jgi:Ni/Fe-hydrogenase subunit HybB-like protein
LGLYLVIKVVELFVTGDYQYLLEGGAPTIMYIVEMVGGVIVPILFFADPKSRNNLHGITWAAFYTMGGLILNRMNSALFFFKGGYYLPSLPEIAVSVGLTCLGLILFDAAVRFLPILPEPHKKVETNQNTLKETPNA